MRDASRRAEALASAFRAENEALIALVVGMDEREWASDCPDEGRSVGVVVGHIAEGHLIIGHIVRAIADGRPLPVQAQRTVEQGAAYNARQARRLASVSRDHGLRMLRTNTEQMARFIGRLSDEDLRREAVGVDGLTLADEIERGLIGHLQGHARAIRLAVMEGRASSLGTNSEAADPARLDEVRDEKTRTDESLVDDAHETAREVGRALTDALGEDLVAVYLHGSAVLGGFRWERSDLDLLALSRTALSDQQFGRVVSALVPLPYPANGLEFTLMTAGEASQPELPAPRFQIHLTTGGWHAARKVVDGRLRDGDHDLVLHLAVCREHGEAIVGPPARSSLTALPEPALESAMRDEIGWARENGPPEYLVLTSARAWLFFATHRIASKIDAGAWAAARDAEPAVIEAALARQRGAAATIPTHAAERFAERVERLIRRAEARTAK
jgi:hypothetical protein